MYGAIEPARLCWIEHGGHEQPFSELFNDIYFSSQDGLAESRHVFLDANNLTTRLSKLANHELFIVAELGFGSGLNILALWQLWQQVRPDNHSYLHIISIEKHPFTPEDIKQAMAPWIELYPLVEQLLSQYPPLLPGPHRLIFPNERLRLDLWFGDANHCLPNIHSSSPVCAWFLDGFAPKKNPQLWSQDVFEHILRLSSSHTTLTTFSVAATLKNQLKQHNIPFEKIVGFGQKHHMLRAAWPEAHNQSAPASLVAPKTMAILGAGIAGISLAYSFIERGFDVHLFDPELPLNAASGNPLALIAPKITTISTFSRNLMSLGALSTRRWLSIRAPQALLHHKALQLLTPSKIDDLAKSKAYPAQVFEFISAAQASQQSGIDCNNDALLMHYAGAINPHELWRMLKHHPKLHLYRQSVHRYQHNLAGHIELFNQDNHPIFNCDRLLIASPEATDTLTKLPKLKIIRGQLSYFEHSVAPKLPLIYDGYVATYPTNATPPHIIMGASFVRDDHDIRLRTEEHEHNLQLLEDVVPAYAQSIRQHTNLNQWQGRVSLRAQPPNYMPWAGKLERDVWILTGLGSKGFSFAPLCAEIIASTLLNEPLPVGIDLAKLIRPPVTK